MIIIRRHKLKIGEDVSKTICSHHKIGDAVMDRITKIMSRSFTLSEVRALPFSNCRQNVVANKINASYGRAPAHITLLLK